MSLNPFTQPLNHLIKPSVQKRLLIIVPHIMGFILLISVSAIPLWLKFILVPVILFSAIYYSRLHLQQTLKKSVTSIRQDSIGNWLITSYDKEHESEPKTVILLASSFISKYLIVLNYRDINKSYYSAIITQDSISCNEFRRLRVRLKLTNIKKS